jgi:hypothetical protein
MRIEIHTSVCPYSNDIHILLLLIKLIPGSLKVKCVLFSFMNVEDFNHWPDITSQFLPSFSQCKE